MAAQELESEKRRLIRERTEVMKESHSMEVSDSMEIFKLQKRIRELESSQTTLAANKKDLERKLKNVKDELDETRMAFEEAREKIETAVLMREEFERRGALMVELRDQLEEYRAYTESAINDGILDGRKQPRPAPTELSVILKRDGTGEWEWTPWLTNIREKAWQRDIKGLREEIDDLTQHRQQAYTKLRTELDTVVTHLVSYMPSPIKAITTRVVGIPAVAPALTKSP
jgi:chromosome segregation ATPase